MSVGGKEDGFMSRNSKDDSLGRKKKVEAIRDKYFECTRKMRLCDVARLTTADYPAYRACSTYAGIVESAFQGLDPISRMIINKDFFYNDYVNWWVGIYSKSSYYRLRDKAIRAFLEGAYVADEKNGGNKRAGLAPV